MNRRQSNKWKVGEKYKFQNIWGEIQIQEDLESGQKYWDKFSLTVKTNAINLLDKNVFYVLVKHHAAATQDDDDEDDDADDDEDEDDDNNK